MTHTNLLDSELIRLDAASLRLRIDAFEDLVLDDEAGQPRPAVALRCFPVTHRDKWIMLRDKEGEEIGLIDDIANLPAESRRALQTELERTHIMPRITRIYDILDRHGVPAWEVETDRGPRTVEIRSSRRDIRLLGAGRVLLRDADGNHFEIPNYHQLDPASRTRLEGEI